jgi:hypothetical protein
MKRLLIAAICALLAALVLSAQPAKPASSKAAGLGKPGAAANEDVNIRAYIELLRTDVRNSKSQIMAEVMQLDAAQAAKFWPIYKDFEAELSTLGDQVVALVKNYSDHYTDLTDAVADQLGVSALAIEQQRNEIKKKYYGRMKEGVGAVTAVRFLQVENQLERLVDLQIAAQLPVIGDK